MRLKCAACGYEKRTEEFTVDDVVYFRSGKRRGQIKEVKKKTVVLHETDPDWIPITLRGLEEFRRPVREEYRGWGTDITENVELFACPQCGTVRIEGNL